MCGFINFIKLNFLFLDLEKNNKKDLPYIIFLQNFTHYTIFIGPLSRFLENEFNFSEKNAKALKAYWALLRTVVLLNYSVALESHFNILKGFAQTI